MVVIGSIVLGRRPYANLHLSTEEFFRFANRAEESRFLRATAASLASYWSSPFCG